MIRPIMLMMFNVSCVRNNMTATPNSDNGSDNMIASGCVNDPNCDARIR